MAKKIGRTNKCFKPDRDSYNKLTKEEKLSFHRFKMLMKGRKK